MNVVIHRVVIHVHTNSDAAAAISGAELLKLLTGAGDTPSATAGTAAPADNAIRFFGDVNEGDPIHWAGQKFAFDGVVANGSRARNADPDAVLFVRRNDTGKLVSLTQDDLDTGGLTRRNG